MTTGGEPHPHGCAGRIERQRVRERRVNAEQRVITSLHEQGRHRTNREGREARAGEHRDPGGVESTVDRCTVRERAHVGVEAPAAFGAHRDPDPARARGRSEVDPTGQGARGEEKTRPPDLQRARRRRTDRVGCERGGEVVPGRDRHDGVDPVVQGTADQREAAAVGRAHQCDARIVGSVTQHLVASGERVDQRDQVAALAVTVGQADRALRVTEAACARREHHVATSHERLRAHALGAAVAAEPVQQHDRRCGRSRRDAVGDVQLRIEHDRCRIIRRRRDRDGEQLDAAGGRCRGAPGVRAAPLCEQPDGAVDDEQREHGETEPTQRPRWGPAEGRGCVLVGQRRLISRRRTYQNISASELNNAIAATVSRPGGVSRRMTCVS